MDEFVRKDALPDRSGNLPYREVLVPGHLKVPRHSYCDGRHRDIPKMDSPPNRINGVRNVVGERLNTIVGEVRKYIPHDDFVIDIVQCFAEVFEAERLLIAISVA